jgi:hypothetical protein
MTMIMNAIPGSGFMNYLINGQLGLSYYATPENNWREILHPLIPEALARRAALLRRQAQRGSAVDAIVVALAEPGGPVLTSDLGDLDTLAGHADDVTVERV